MENLSYIQYIQNLEKLLLRHGERAGGFEMTAGNYDDEGRLIGSLVPTIVTDFCEMGAYGNIIYFTFVIYSGSYNKKIFDAVRDFPNGKIYGFLDFNNVLYPTENFNYEKFEEAVKKDKYLQFQFNFDFKTTSQEKLLGEYLKLKNIFIESGAKVVKQIDEGEVGAMKKYLDENKK